MNGRMVKEEVKLLFLVCLFNPFTTEVKCFFEKKIIHKFRCVASQKETAVSKQLVGNLLSEKLI